MRGIVSAAGYVPYRRLARSQVTAFLGAGGGKGTRAVAGHDEDTTTMGVAAARLALRSVPGTNPGAPATAPAATGTAPAAPATAPAATGTATAVPGDATAAAGAASSPGGPGEAGGPSVPGALSAPSALWFATASPAYLDKTNATALHRALRLPAEVPAYDFGGALRSGIGALAAALAGGGTVLVVAADQRDGLPTSADESLAGDGAAALVVGDGGAADQAGPGSAGRTLGSAAAEAGPGGGPGGSSGGPGGGGPGGGGAPLLAEHVGGASATDELMDRWRAPGDRRSRQWEERFGETRYLALGREAWDRALAQAGLAAAGVDRVVVTGMHARAVKALPARLGLAEGALAGDLSATVGQAGTAHPLLVLASVLEEEAAGQAAGALAPGRTIALVHLADGADVLLFRTTGALATWHPARPVADQVAQGADLPYGKFLSWRGMLTPEPPRRPEPPRVSSTAAWRSGDWKYGFVGSRDRTSNAVHLPPARVSMDGGAFDDMAPVPMADAVGTVVTCTVDRMAYSPSPPVVFAVVDFDGGGRFPVELTDVDVDVDEGALAAGDRVEMTFRRLFTADGIHDYFWKARPVPAAATTGTGAGAAGKAADGKTEGAGAASSGAARGASSGAVGTSGGGQG